jgi:hypothetical protein
MKKALALLLVAIFTISISCSQSSEVNAKADKKAPFIKFEILEYDYGTITQEHDGICVFVFKNTGKNPLVLSNLRPSCGCTVPKWSKEPIKGGDESNIEVKYNTRRPGSFSKSITVYQELLICSSDSPSIICLFRISFPARVLK